MLRLAGKTLWGILRFYALGVSGSWTDDASSYGIRGRYYFSR